MSTALLFSSVCLVAGGLLVAVHVLSRRRPSLQARLARAEGQLSAAKTGVLVGEVPEPLYAWGARVRKVYEEQLRIAGRSEATSQFLLKKVVLTVGVPLVPLLPYSAAVRHPPSPVLVLLLAVAGFFVPDLVVRGEAGRRRETICLDLPEAISIMALSLRVGQSLRQALELAARDCEGPLAEELTRALSLARRDRTLGEREALVVIAKNTGEPGFLRFAELLNAKESPYVEFLRAQAQSLRSEQNRYLERAADRAYLRMQVPLWPLIVVFGLILAYGFLHLLTQNT
jgi:Flp pilus assembly protein TadB